MTAKVLGLTKVQTQATADDGFQPVKGKLEIDGVSVHKLNMDHFKLKTPHFQP